MRGASTLPPSCRAITAGPPLIRRFAPPSPRGEKAFYCISASAPFNAWAIWSGQLVGLRPQVVPSMRAMASSAFMPGSSLAMPFRLPSQPPRTCTLLMVWSSFHDGADGTGALVVVRVSHDALLLKFYCSFILPFSRLPCAPWQCRRCVQSFRHWWRMPPPGAGSRC